jgi:hypothetical protein
LPKPRVILAADDERVHKVVARILSTKYKIDVVGCAHDGPSIVPPEKPQDWYPFLAFVGSLLAAAVIVGFSLSIIFAPGWWLR